MDRLSRSASVPLAGAQLGASKSIHGLPASAPRSLLAGLPLESPSGVLFFSSPFSCCPSTGLRLAEGGEGARLNGENVQHLF